MLQRALSLPLLLDLYGFEDVLEHLETCDRWMRNDRIFCPIVEVMRKRVHGWVMRRVIPPLQQPAMAILPMMPISRHLQSPLCFEDPFRHLNEVAIGQQHAIPVMSHLFELRIPNGPAHDLHVTHEWAGTQEGIHPLQIRLNHASVAARNVPRRS